MSDIKMNRNNCTCYYRDCQKKFQNLIYLITHVNLQHLKTKAVKCEMCDEYFESEESFLKHKRDGLKSKDLSPSCGFLEKFKLFQGNEYIPPDILTLPVLPPISEERTRDAFQYKMPLSVKIYESLTTVHVPSRE